jgi:NitT/TauT family transport system permease protein
LALGGVIGFWLYENGPGAVSPLVLPKLGQVLDSFWRQLWQGELWSNAAVTSVQIVAAFLLASVVGTGFGFVVSQHPLSSSVAERLLAWGYMYPFVLLYPLFVLWLGVGIPSKIGFGATAAVFPIAYNTVRGLRSIDQRYLRVGRAFGASRWMIDIHIRTGAARPMILSGLRLGVGMVTVSIVVAELLGSYAGLGHLIEGALNRLNAVDMYGTIIFLVILTFCMQAAMERILRPKYE